MNKVHASYILMALVWGIVLGVAGETLWQWEWLKMEDLFWWLAGVTTLVFLIAWTWPRRIFVVVILILGLGLGGARTGVALMEQEKNLKKSEQSGILVKVRDGFAERVRKNMPEEESQLGLAYLLGIKEDLPWELKEGLKVAGLSHIVVASGTHLSIIVVFVRRTFGKISRFCGAFVAVGLILIFAGMIGWTASIMRAGLVSIMTLLAWYVGRWFIPLRLILIVMAITLMINPLFAIDVGWLLSFASYSGILLVMPMLEKLLYGQEKPPKVASLILMTVSATLMCAPISLFVFGSVSLIAVVANLIILPSMSLVMGLVFLAGVVAEVPVLGPIVGKITEWALDFHLAVMRFFGEQKAFLVSIEPNNPWVLLLFVPIVLAMVWVWWRERKANNLQREKILCRR